MNQTPKPPVFVASTENMMLTKVIPARRVTMSARAVQKLWMRADVLHRVRAGAKNPMRECQWCGHRFASDEVVGLAICDDGNKALCGGCCDGLLASIGRTA